ncbi:MAG: hypothetical protein ACOYOK_13325, partial [Pseudobdellovibrionaceae bacterium]
MRPNLKFSALMISALFSTPLARANIVGTDAQNFNPTTSGLDFVTVQSARTLDPGVFNIGLFLNGAANTLSFLDDADPDAKSSRTKIKDTLLSADLNFGVGLGKKIDIGLSLPFLLKQDIENSDRVAYFSTTGNTEQRLNAKYRFFESDDFSAATVLSVNRNNIANNPYTGSSPGLITNLELAFLKKINDSWLGLNLGHRWRDSGKSLIGTFGIDPIPNQGIYSLAWSRMFAGTDSKLIIEVFGSFPSQTSSSNSNFTDRDRSNLETLLGIKNQYSENLALHAGAGTEIVQGFGTPDYRIYAGINWNFGPLFQKTVKQAYQQKIQEQPQVTP